MSDPHTEGERLWWSIVEDAGFTPRTRELWFVPCKVKRYEPGERLVIDALSAIRADYIRCNFTQSLNWSRDRVCPGLKLVLTAPREL